ncbi:MAG TPA: hypothetical protein VHC00_19120 [Rhizobiaceae bacterium]|nr:hypothetical protein [Rhizobiaceae bacterium]
MAEQQRYQILGPEKRTALSKIGKPQRGLMQGIHAQIMNAFLTATRIDKPKDIPLSSQGNSPLTRYNSGRRNQLFRRPTGPCKPRRTTDYSAATA